MSITILYSISDQDSAKDGDIAFHEEVVLPDGRSMSVPG